MEQDALKKVNHPIPPTDQRWLSIKDFAVVYQVSKSAQQRLRSAGMAHSRIGGMIRYDRLKIDEFFSDHQVIA